ncbi:MAG: bifunctional phosphopantothenoylcysteine decarboxylase/phosphopantothenate--cysteine ligase CoaBC [Proteobacteria bacterium]|nr:MAG: bifunctional phosphopantothenoylcysteine decarboxylase/phosphopantothenate--cysteine ligase CoaBC [Pseudomonadota bacterium]
MASMPSAAKYKVILGVTGGIAAYKAAELTRLFKKAGHEVRVVLTASAEKFVGPLTFHSLSNEPVLRSLHEGAYDLSATSHIDLAQWGDILVVAPATANFLAKYAHGFADDALLTEGLAFQGPVLVAPAMNTRMWDAPVTRENLAKLKARGVNFAGPASGGLACGEIGEGKMAEPAEIFAAAITLLAHARGRPLAGKQILVTSGPTRSYIDRVRFLTNRSSGRMGHAIAAAAERLGAEVTLVTGPVEPRFACLARGKVIEVETGEEMLAACLPTLKNAHAVFATAAVADFKMPAVIEGKLRREGTLKLEMEAAVDVLAELGKQKADGQIFFGFAAEAGEGEAEFAKARDKIRRKNLDFLALNNISRRDIGFDAEENEVFLFRGDAAPEKLDKSAKAHLAETLLAKVFPELK